ncbi:hypothetical protein HCJ99_30840, partial [Streptomyces sp. C1-2]|nr:hypothetical protein [Streptomyces sp. C1-2]
ATWSAPDPADISRHESFKNPEPSSFFSVVISADGSAAIDGVPVTAVGGEAADAAILGNLHRHASDRGRHVTAAISDPSVANVTFVEVAPDGSSRLVDPPPEHSPIPMGPAGPGDSAGPAGRYTPMGEAEPPRVDDALNGELDDDEESGNAPYGLQRPFGLPHALATSGSLLRRPKTDGASTMRQSDDEFRSSSLRHRVLVVGPVAVGVALLVIMPLTLLGGESEGDGENKAAGASDELSGAQATHRSTSVPTVSVSPSLSPSATSSPKATKKPKPKDSHANGTTEGISTITIRPPKATTTVTAKPALDTAATFVNRLSRNDPGRHICYRAYVASRGWQKPVCDGTVAGTTNQNRPIKALDIAVSGTGGVAANAFVHKPGSTDGKGAWKPHWTPNTRDGKDIYIGSTKKNAPSMLGFAINVGSGGQICQSAHLRDAAWGEWGCVGPRPDYVFGGTLNNDLWLDAVKFTV